MFKAFDFCIPTKSSTVPDSADWLHQVKYDGYRLRLERDGDRMRPITRGGYDWTKRFPWIVEAARKIRHKRFVLDGEASSSALMASATSTRCIPANTMRKSNCVLSTS